LEVHFFGFFRGSASGYDIIRGYLATQSIGGNSLATAACHFALDIYGNPFFFATAKVKL